MRLYDRCRKKLDNASYVFWRSSLTFHSSNNNIGNRITFIQNERYLSFHLFAHKMPSCVCGKSRVIYSVYMSRILLHQFHSLCKLNWKISLYLSVCAQVSLFLLLFLFPLSLSFILPLPQSLSLSLSPFLPLSVLFHCRFY